MNIDEYNKPKADVKAESTWLSPAIKSKQELIDWVLTGLGWPLVTVELSEEQLNWCIQNALEKYTKYAYFGPDKYLLLNLKQYEKGKGLNLEEFHISSIKTISFIADRSLMLGTGDIFWGGYAWMGQNGGYPFFNTSTQSFVGCWTTYHNMHEFFELSRRMSGSMPDWQYDKTTKYLRLMPEPMLTRGNEVACATCQVEPPLEELYGNEYVKRLCSAYAKILLGTVRSKFQNVQLLGGGQVDTSIGDKGQAELDKIMEEIIKEESKGQWAYVF